MLPIVARSDVEPAATFTGYCCCSRLAIVGTARFALPSPVPTARPVNAPNRFVSVYERASGTPIVADAMTSGFGETDAPRIDAVSVNGVLAASDVRLASTTTSQTPACGASAVTLANASATPLIRRMMIVSLFRIRTLRRAPAPEAPASSSSRHHPQRHKGVTFVTPRVS